MNRMIVEVLGWRTRIFGKLRITHIKRITFIIAN